MYFAVTYRDKSGARTQIEIEAASREGVWPILKERGISAIRVDEGRVKKERRKSPSPSGRPQRPYPLLGVVLVAAAIAVGAVFVLDRSETPPEIATEETESVPEAPKAIEAGPAIGEKIATGCPTGYSKTPAEYIARIDKALASEGEAPKSGTPPKIFAEGCVPKKLMTANANPSDGLKVAEKPTAKRSASATRPVSRPSCREKSRQDTAVAMSKTTLEESCLKNQQWTDPKTGMTWFYDVHHQKDSQTDVAEIKGASDCSGHLNIPAKINEFPVERIGGEAFCNQSAISSITIPEGVKSIGYSAFADCINVTNVLFPVTLEDIGSGAFAWCSSLLNVKLPDGITRLGGSGAFAWCTNLATVTLPKSIEKLSFNAFHGCENLKTLHCYNGDAPRIQMLLKSSWRRFEIFGNDLVAISIENNPVRKALYAEFSWSDSKTGARWEYDVCCSSGSTNKTTTLKIVRFWPTFDRYVAIPRLIDGCEVRRIGAKAFSGLRGIKSIAIPSSIEEIDDFAFTGTGIKSILIPASVKRIGEDAFSCRRLAAINVDGNNPYFKSVDGVLYDRDQKTLVTIPWGRRLPYAMPESVTNDVDKILGFAHHECAIKIVSKDTFDSPVDGVLFSKDRRRLLSCNKNFSGTYVVPSSVTSIAERAFMACERLSGIVLPKNLTRIGDWAFRDCTNLLSIAIPPNVEHIGNNAFEGCISLQTVSIPGSVKQIGRNAFNACGLDAVKINDGVLNIGERAFWQCQLKSVLIPASVTNLSASTFLCENMSMIDVDPANRCYVSVDGVLYDKKCGVLIACPIGKKSLVIPMGVTNVAEGACGTTTMREIFIPRSIKNIRKKSLGFSMVGVVVHVQHGDADRLKTMLTVSGGYYCDASKFIEDYSPTNKVPIVESKKSNGSGKGKENAR